LNKSTKLINELFDYYVSNYLASYGSPYLTQAMLTRCKKTQSSALISPIFFPSAASPCMPLSPSFLQRVSTAR